MSSVVKALDDERQLWFEGLDLEDKEERLFELEMLLNGLERFFEAKNLPIPQADYLLTKNFIKELSVACDIVIRICTLLETLLNATPDKVLYSIKNYLAEELVKDSHRNKLRNQTLTQTRPEQSLYILLLGFQNIRGVLEGLCSLNHCTYQVYMSMGDIIEREIVCNRFFNPARYKKFRPEFDRIWNRRITQVLKDIEEKELQRCISLVIIYIFRILHYLTFIDTVHEESASLKSSLLVFSLVKSEANHLHTFMEKELLGLLKKSKFKNKYRELNDITDTLMFHLKMEQRRISEKEMQNISKLDDPVKIYINVENCQGILRNFFYQCIYEIIHAFDPDIERTDLDVYFATKRRNSVKLRSHIWRFLKLMDKFEEQSITQDLESFNLKYYQALMALVDYFEKECVRLLRYDDFIEFRKFFDFLKKLSERDIINDDDIMEQFIKESSYFRIYLEAMFEKISRRNELQDVPFNEEEEAKELVSFFREVINKQEKAPKAG